MGTGELMLGATLRWTSVLSGEVEILLVASCYKNQDKLRPGGPAGVQTSLPLPFEGTNKQLSWE